MAGNCQKGILAPLPEQAVFVEFEMLLNADGAAALSLLGKIVIDETIVVGLGRKLLSAAGKTVPGLRAFPALSGPGCEVPSTQAALWVWLRGSDPGVLFHRARKMADKLSAGFRVVRFTNAYKYDGGLDLSGYEDGTENPQDDEALKTAIVGDAQGALAGSSFVAVQNWLHDFEVLDALSQSEKDNIIGRRLIDNEEFDEAPASAHVKRTAQESFTPEAFVVRRSMPWNDGLDGGFMFVAFGTSNDAFEAQLRRMAGVDDGIIDGLFRFTEPVSGSYFWCPPVTSAGRLDCHCLTDLAR